jgi:SRSO17 transposase
LLTVCHEGESVRVEVPAMSAFPPIPAPLEVYAAQCDALFRRARQRAAFRQDLAGWLLPAERTQTLTALGHAEPVVGAPHPAGQRLPWFRSESTWAAAAITSRRLALLGDDPGSAPHPGGGLIVAETGDRKGGQQTAPVGRQDLGNRGTIDNGVVRVRSLWADARVSSPLAVAP